MSSTSLYKLFPVQDVLYQSHLGYKGHEVLLRVLGYLLQDSSQHAVTISGDAAASKNSLQWNPIRTDGVPFCAEKEQQRDCVFCGSTVFTQAGVRSPNYYQETGLSFLNATSACENPCHSSFCNCGDCNLSPLSAS